MPKVKENILYELKVSPGMWESLPVSRRCDD